MSVHMLSSCGSSLLTTTRSRAEMTLVHSSALGAQTLNSAWIPKEERRGRQVSSSCLSLLRVRCMCLLLCKLSLSLISNNKSPQQRISSENSLRALG